MPSANALLCRRDDNKEQLVDLPPFVRTALSDLVTPAPNEGESVVTLLATQAQATLRNEAGALFLRAEGKKYTYALRIMSGCVHAAVRNRHGRRMRVSVCLNTVWAVTEMLESIVCDIALIEP